MRRFTYYFNSNHPLLHNKNISVFYQTIRQEYKTYFKLPPTNIIKVHDQSLWLNKHITINNKLIFWKQLQKHGINTINNLLDNENKFLAHAEISLKFGIKCTYLDIAQIQSCIPKTWKIIIKNRLTNSTLDNIVTLKICINNQYKDIQKTKCKDF